MAAQRDISEIVPYSQQHDRGRIPAANQFIIERHVPGMFDSPFHHHTSVEVNFLEDCDMTYAFSGDTVPIRRGRIAVFWGAQPHRVTAVQDVGQITNLYLSLGQFLRWGLPDEMVRAILSGAVICARHSKSTDPGLFDGLWSERNRPGGHWQRMHLDEIEERLRRLGLEGWTTLLDPGRANKMLEVDPRAMRYVESLLRYVAENFSRPVTVSDVASAVNLSVSRANAVFRDVMGVSIKAHLTRTRLSHARMLLHETDQKILTIALDSGYRSLSSFYATFSAHTSVPPERYRKEGRQIIEAP